MDRVQLYGLLALVVGAAVRAVKSDTANAALARFGLPPIPKASLPWVALVLGFALAGVNALAAGKALPEALAEAAAGIFSGMGAVLGHELVIEKLRGGKEIGE